MTTKKAIKEVLSAATGESFNSVHTKDTPARWLKMMQELTTPQDFTFTTFPAPAHKEMIIIQDIPFYSLCAHHLAPFFGKAHIAYIPNKTIVGLSKIPRTVEYFMRGLTVQENLTSTIADFLEDQLAPKAVGVVTVAEHFCMAMRGVRVIGSTTTTSAMRGVFLDTRNTARAEFLSLLK